MALDSQAPDTPDETTGSFWLFVLGEVPERWKGRARAANFIPLLPEEAGSVLANVASVEVDAGGDELLKLAARGLPATSISRRSGLSLRTVHRRLARLRDQLQVETTAELASELSRRGFGE